jgi:hypothetical protein
MSGSTTLIVLQNEGGGKGPFFIGLLKDTLINVMPSQLRWKTAFL